MRGMSIHTCIYVYARTHIYKYLLMHCSVCLQTCFEYVSYPFLISLYHMLKNFSRHDYALVHNCAHIVYT